MAKITDDPFLTRSLPSCVEAEYSIIGSVLVYEGNTEILDMAASLLVPADFFLDSNKLIFTAMLELWEKGHPINFITVTDHLRKNLQLERAGGMAGLSDMTRYVGALAIEHYSKIIRSKASLRKLIAASNQNIMDCFAEELEPDEIIELAERRVFEIGDDRKTKSFQTAANLAKLRLEKLELHSANPSMVTGIPTGLLDFDAMTAGMQRQELILIAARPSQGKTALALNMAQYAGKNGYTVGIFSLEMSGEQLVSRLLSSEAQVDAHRLRTGYLARDEWGRLADALRRLCEYKIHIDDTPGITVMDMRAKARRLKAEHGLDMLIIDYLQLMSGRGKIENRQQEVSQISRDLKALAKELDCPVIALSQLSRASENRSEHRPQLSDLRESGSLEQDADVVCFIYREEVYEPDITELRGLAELIIGKQRNGPTGTANLVFVKEFTTFMSMYREREPEQSYV